MSCQRQQPRRSEAAAAPCPGSCQGNVFPVGKWIQTGHTQHTRVCMQVTVRVRLRDVNTYIHGQKNYASPRGLQKSLGTMQRSGFAITRSHRDPRGVDRPRDLNKRLLGKSFQGD